MFYKPFRYEVHSSNCGQVLDRNNELVCEVMQASEDELNTEDHMKLQLIVDALNETTSKLAE